MSDKQWTTDEIAADIAEGSKFKAPEQIDIQTRLARRVVELKACLAVALATVDAGIVEGEGGG